MNNCRSEQNIANIHELEHDIDCALTIALRVCVLCSGSSSSATAEYEIVFVYANSLRCFCVAGCRLHNRIANPDGCKMQTQLTISFIVVAVAIHTFER